MAAGVLAWLWSRYGLAGVAAIACGVLLAGVGMYAWHIVTDREALQVENALLDREIEQRRAAYAASEAGREREAQIIRLGRDIAVRAALSVAAVRTDAAAIDEALRAGEASHASDDCDAALDLLFDRLGRLHPAASP